MPFKVSLNFLCLTALVEQHSGIITFHEIVRYDPATFEGKGFTIAVFDRNATGSLAPFNGMMIVGTHEEDPNTKAATFSLWEWESGISLLTGGNTTASMGESPPSRMNTTAADGE